MLIVNQVPLLLRESRIHAAPNDGRVIVEMSSMTDFAVLLQSKTYIMSANTYRRFRGKFTLLVLPAVKTKTKAMRVGSSHRVRCFNCERDRGGEMMGYDGGEEGSML